MLSSFFHMTLYNIISFRSSIFMTPGFHDGRGNKREGCEKQVCHRVTCKDCERKECIHGGKERVKEQYTLPTLTCGSKTWTWHRAQQLRVCAVKISYLRGVCGVTKWEDGSNESMYERCGIGSCANEMKWNG